MKIYKYPSIRSTCRYYIDLHSSAFPVYDGSFYIYGFTYKKCLITHYFFLPYGDKYKLYDN